MSDIKRDLNDLNFWNTDQSVDPPVMTRGMVGKDSTGTWRYLAASASGYMMVSGSFGSVSFSDDAGDQRVSSIQGDAGLLRVSAIGVSVTTSPLSADSTSVSAIQEGANRLRISAFQGDGANLQVSAKSDSAGQLRVSADLFPNTVGGLTVYNSVSVSSAAAVKAAAGSVYGYYAWNMDSKPNYIKLYNLSAGVTLGTDTPVVVIALPASAAANVEYPHGLAGFTAGISIAATSAVAHNATSLPTTSAVGINIFYK